MERIIRAPRGKRLNCKGWHQEAALRMLMNNLDPEVAERPEELVVYGGRGKAARNWECYEQIVRCLKGLENDETLLIQSGKAVGIFKTHPMAPRVLMANSLVVPAWATPDKFWELEAMGLTMFGQMTAGSWIYIGTQGILQGTYETFAAAGREHFGGSLKGKLVVSGGLGGMGGAQPLATTMNEGVFIGIEVDRDRIQRRIKTGYLDMMTDSLDEALNLADEARQKGMPRSIGLLGNTADILPELDRRDIVPDLLTDQTSAHDELNGYVPHGIPYEEALRLRRERPQEYVKRALESIAIHVQAMLSLMRKGAQTFEYGNNIRAQARRMGVEDAFQFPGFVLKYIRPLFCKGRGPFRWVALSGEPQDIYRTDEAIMRLFPRDEALTRWLKMAREKVHFQGLPARICWLGYGERERAGVLFNDMVKRGELGAPIVIGRDHLDSGSVASPYRETEGMRDGSDAIADWPILNALLNAVSGASWVAVHHGGGVGIGYAIHAGMVIVADGERETEDRLRRVLTTDPGSGIMRHADAGYELAIDVAKKEGIKIPGINF